MAVLIHNLSVRSHSFTFYCKRKEKQISRYKCRIALADFSMFLLNASTQVWQTTQSFASSYGGTTIYQTRKLEKPSKRVWFSQTLLGNGKCRGWCAFGGIATTIEEAILELTKRGAGMTTLFLLVTGVCQSLNELAVASVTKKSGQNWTSRTACYGPVKARDTCQYVSRPGIVSYPAYVSRPGMLVRHPAYVSMLGMLVRHPA